ncbi:Hypothetical protein, predicted lipoprotein [Metamycoplasma auris 15026]|uniref:N-terminal Ras-GEF domain-containing protein n=1 Tax=Metamycoplasma auris 15026 TaxID=1188233 RepID=N9VD58_9BACT|nr:hypothetical protein [Metamycoplasma auris]ENY69346.1 Hypothetical protein, predicted lipoprotein [Metamycoplasma auris 15026]
MKTKRNSLIYLGFVAVAALMPLVVVSCTKANKKIEKSNETKEYNKDNKDSNKNNINKEKSELNKETAKNQNPKEDKKNEVKPNKNSDQSSNQSVPKKNEEPKEKEPKRDSTKEDIKTMLDILNSLNLTKETFAKFKSDFKKAYDISNKYKDKLKDESFLKEYKVEVGPLKDLLDFYPFIEDKKDLNEDESFIETFKVVKEAFTKSKQ